MSSFDLMFAEDLEIPTLEMSKEDIVKGEVTKEMKALAREFYLANNAMNKLKKQAETARALLYTQMKDAAVSKFYFTTTIKNEEEVIKHTLDIVISASEVNTVDVAKLKELIPGDKFMEVISATQAAVKDKVGEPVLKQCLIKSMGTENVSVKLKK